MNHSGHGNLYLILLHGSLYVLCLEITETSVSLFCLTCAVCFSACALTRRKRRYSAYATKTPLSFIWQRYGNHLRSYFFFHSLTVCTFNSLTFLSFELLPMNIEITVHSSKFLACVQQIAHHREDGKTNIHD